MNEQAITLLQAGFSSVVNEAGDFSCALFDAQGNLLAQSSGTPGQLHSLPPAIRYILKHFPANTLREGDILITNDPWEVSGHSNDITIARPIFCKDKLVALTANCCHAVDIGGGGLAVDARDIYEEGLQIPLMKLYSAGQPNDDLLRIMEKNVRHPDQFRGDLMAQISAVEVTARDLCKLLDEFQLPNLETISSSMRALTESRMRQAIAQLPKGSYSDTVYLDGREESLWLKLLLTVEDDSLFLDFSGSAPQVNFGINCVPNYAMAYANFILKCVLLPDVPHNAGTFAPIRYHFPKGSIVNPTYPAPVAARHMTGHFAAFVVLGTLSQAIPKRIMAESAGPGSATMQINGAWNDGRPYAILFFNPGGFGARSTSDGLPTVNFPPNRWNIPVEVIETVSPLVVLEKELVQDSGGAGKFRGGLGQRVKFMINSSQPSWISAMLERVKHQPRGFSGGSPGKNAAFTINGEEAEPKKRHLLQPGDVLEVYAAGSGGYGPPVARDPGEVAKDVQLGFVSPEQAEMVYRVAIDPHTLECDLDLTRRLRAAVTGTDVGTRQ